MLIRSAIVVVLAIPGALAAAWLGFMAAEFSGDASPSPASFFCWHIWGLFGGACFGAIPGLLVGWLLRVRWVIPLLGGAIGVVPGLFEASGMHILGGTNIGGVLSAAFVVGGFCLGLWLWIAVLEKERNRHEAFIAKSAGGE